MRRAGIQRYVKPGHAGSKVRDCTFRHGFLVPGVTPCIMGLRADLYQLRMPVGKTGPRNLFPVWFVLNENSRNQFCPVLDATGSYRSLVLCGTRISPMAGTLEERESECPRGAAAYCESGTKSSSRFRGAGSPPAAH